jgi:hypothetical protein
MKIGVGCSFIGVRMFRSKEQQAAQSKSSKLKQSLSADWSQYVWLGLASIEFVYQHMTCLIPVLV